MSRGFNPGVAVGLVLVVLLASVLNPVRPGTTALAVGDREPPANAPLRQDDDDGDDDDDYVPPVVDPAPPVAQEPPPVPVVAPPPIRDNDGDPSTDGVRPGQAIIRLKVGTDAAAFAVRFGLGILGAMSPQSTYLVQLSAGTDETAAAASLEDEAEVLWAEPNYVNEAPEGRPSHFFVSSSVDAESLSGSPAGTLLGLTEALTCARGSGVTVAVIDTGIDATHPDLAGRVMARGINVLDGSDNTADVGNGFDDDADGLVDEMTGHGTHVAGIVAQVAPGALILPIKALDSDGIGDAFYLATAISAAVDAGADVLNLSLSTTRDVRVLGEAVAAARSAGVVVVAAAGNQDREAPPEYPAADSNVLGVAATDPTDRKSTFSNFGPDLALSAPGAEIVSTFPGGGYASWSGTSMAAPLVAGAAALLLGQDPTLTDEAVTARLTRTAVALDTLNPTHAGKLGAGRLDIGAAVGCDG